MQALDRMLLRSLSRLSQQIHSKRDVKCCLPTPVASSSSSC
jgi:hypothetical protein